MQWKKCRVWECDSCGKTKPVDLHDICQDCEVEIEIKREKNRPNGKFPEGNTRLD